MYYHDPSTGRLTCLQLLITVWLFHYRHPSYFIFRKPNAQLWRMALLTIPPPSTLILALRRCVPNEVWSPGQSQSSPGLTQASYPPSTIDTKVDQMQVTPSPQPSSPVTTRSPGTYDGTSSPWAAGVATCLTVAVKASGLACWTTAHLEQTSLALRWKKCTRCGCSAALCQWRLP